MASADPPRLTPISQAIEQLLPTLPVIERVEQVAMEDSQGRILAADFAATGDVPPWDNSAMDGFAVRAADTAAVPATLEVAQRIAAGAVGDALQPGTAARIFTGAPLPANADAVVMQENSRIEDGHVTILQSVVAGENLRQRGEDMTAGQVLFRQGHRLRPQDLGVLASVGATQVDVRPGLRVALLTTGDELVVPGNPLLPGQIYNSNYFALAALLKNLRAEVLPMGVVEDSLEATQQVLQQAAAEADCIISTGGVSVGEEDHVRTAVSALGQLDLWKLAIKPGKPFASGKVAGTQFFGLPGNPVSAFVTFILLVRPFLLTMLGCTDCFPRWLPVRCDVDLRQSGERQEYMRVSLVSNTDDGCRAVPFQNQSSGVGSSLSLAEGLAIIPPHTAIARGDALEFLPFSELIY